VAKLELGSLIEDNGKIGVVTRIITSGSLNTSHDLIKWRNNYEVYYSDGTFSIIGEATLHRLIEKGEVKIL
jgi:hypothetical protein